MCPLLVDMHTFESVYEHTDVLYHLLIVSCIVCCLLICDFSTYIFVNPFISWLTKRGTNDSADPILRSVKADSFMLDHFRVPGST